MTLSKGEDWIETDEVYVEFKYNPDNGTYEKINEQLGKPIMSTHTNCYTDFEGWSIPAFTITLKNGKIVNYGKYYEKNYDELVRIVNELSKSYKIHLNE